MSGYMGNGPTNGKAARFQFNATAGQTTFSGTDANGLTLTYTPGFVEVAVNGFWLTPDEYTATDGSSIVLASGSQAGDKVYAYALSTFSAADALAKTQNGADITNKPGFRQNIGIPAIMRSYLAGLTLSTPGSSATFSVAAGVATDSTNVAVMTLAAAISKTTGAWTVGLGNGALDTGAIANSTWYHVHLIERTDTQTVDVLISLSATAPTLPSGYTLFRRIGSMKTDGSGNWTAFTQVGDEFLWNVSVADVSSATLTASTPISIVLTVPTSIQVFAIFNAAYNSASSTSVLINSTDQAVVTSPSFPNVNMANAAAGGANAGQFRVRTNISAQVRVACSATISSGFSITTQGWIDRRGKDN